MNTFVTKSDIVKSSLRLQTTKHYQLKIITKGKDSFNRSLTHPKTNLLVLLFGTKRDNPAAKC